MEDAIEEICTIVRDPLPPAAAWSKLLDACRRSLHDAPWDRLPVPDIESDIQAAAGWLREQLDSVPAASGVCLLLDTLNTDDGEGKCVSFAASPNHDPGEDSQEWVLDGELAYGGEHLIHGVHELLSTYGTKPWRNYFTFCDYILFLGYSGIVLAAAMDRLSSPRGLLVVWGFHDGDLFVLGRNTDGRFSRICECK